MSLEASRRGCREGTVRVKAAVLGPGEDEQGAISAARERRVAGRICGLAPSKLERVMCL